MNLNEGDNIEPAEVELESSNKMKVSFRRLAEGIVI